MAAPSQGGIYSGGGAVFIGDGNAGRDITNIYHITTVGPSVRTLYRSLASSSSKQFGPVQTELATLVGVLELIVEDQTRLQIDCNEEPALRGLSKDCHDILGHLQELKQHFDSVGSQTQNTWEREQWRAEDLAEIWTRLTTTVASLNAVHRTLIQSSIKGIEEMLETFIAEVRTGKREGSVVTTSSLLPDQKEAWRQLRKELESVGITPALFSQHHDRILKRLLQAVDDGDLIEGDGLPGDTEFPEDRDLPGNEDLIEDNGAEPSDHTNASVTAESYMMESTDMTIPEVGPTRTELSPGDPNTTQPIKRPSRMSRLLFRIVNDTSIIPPAKEGNVVWVQELLRRGADVESKDKDGWTALMWAARNGHTVIVRVLLESGKGDVETKDGNGRTALFCAVTGRHEKVVKLLIEMGKADVALKDNQGWTTLMWAAIGGHEAVTRLLLKTGRVEVAATGEFGWTALSLATRGGHEAVVRLLLETGKTEVESKDADGRPLFICAAIGGHEAVTRLLLETGKVDVEARDGSGWTALTHAASEGHDTVARILLESGKADVESKNQQGQTALMMAASQGHEVVVRLLLETGQADVEARDNNGWTALSYAASRGYDAVARQLFIVGKADVTSKDNFGQTAAMIAAQKGHKAVAVLLSPHAPL